MTSQPLSTFVQRLPRWITHWFGVRERPGEKKSNPVYASYIWAFIGAFGGLACLQAVFGQAAYFIERGVPPLIASYGASAVLCFGVIESPLAQPRAVVGGHFISAFVGVVFTKIFGLHDLAHVEGAQPPRLAWLAASLATATAIVAMQLTKTTHPPAGATALLPVVDKAVNSLSWYFLPVALLSSAIIVSVAMLTNNVQSRYPVFWWSPSPKKAEPRQAPLPLTTPDTTIKDLQQSGLTPVKEIV